MHQTDSLCLLVPEIADKSGDVINVKPLTRCSTYLGSKFKVSGVTKFKPVLAVDHVGKSVFKNGSSKMFGMQTLKNLKRAALTDYIISNFLKAAFLNFTWSILHEWTK